MPNLARRFGGPVEATIGFVAAGGDAVDATVVGPTCSSDDEAWLRRELPAGTTLVLSQHVLRTVAERRRAADIVHVHGLLNPVSSGAAWITRDRAVVIDPFGTLSRYTFTHRRRLLKRLWFAMVDGPSVRRAAALHFTTEAERDEAAWHGIDFTGRAHVVPPPWRTTAPVTAPARPHTGETILFLARPHPKKGLDVLLAAWPAIRAARPHALLIVAGEKRLTAPPGVTFVDFLTGQAKQECLASADVFVLPSHHENFGVAVLEAVAAGVPVVITREVQLSGWIQANRLGAIVPRDPSSVANAVLQVLGDVPLRTRVASGGAATVADAFGLSRVAPALVAMYHDALTRHAHPGYQRLSR